MSSYSSLRTFIILVGLGIVLVCSPGCVSGLHRRGARHQSAAARVRVSLGAENRLKVDFENASRTPLHIRQSRLPWGWRYSMLIKSKPDQAKLLLRQAQEDVLTRWKLYEHMANMPEQTKS